MNQYNQVIADVQQAAQQAADAELRQQYPWFRPPAGQTPVQLPPPPGPRLNDGNLIPSAHYPGAVHKTAWAQGWYAGLFVTTVGGIVIMFGRWWDAWYYAPVIGAATMLLTTSAVGMWWTSGIADLQGFWGRPKGVAAPQVQVAPEVETVEIPQHFDGDLCQIYARKIFDMKFLFMTEPTRPECERAGIPQDYWNHINVVLKVLRLKGERKWETTSYEQANRAWVEAVKFDDDGTARVWHGSGYKIIKMGATPASPPTPAENR
jgi:hypothetical protein